MTQAVADRINAIKKLSGIKDCDGFISVEDLEKKTAAIVHDGLSGVNYLRRISRCPVCELFHYGYINEICIGGQYDHGTGIKIQECDVCSKLDGVQKKELKCAG